MDLGRQKPPVGNKAIGHTFLSPHFWQNVYKMAKNFFLFSFLCSKILFAQSIDNREIYTLLIARTTESIKLDGMLTETTWKSARKAESFWLNAPNDEGKASDSTVVYITYDEKNIYIAAKMKGPSRYVIQSLKRDGDPENSDSFGIVLDPMGQKNLGYLFGVNVGGTQTESMVSAAQGIFAKSVDESWDARWYSAVSQNQDSWTIEMAIPFKSIRYKEGKDSWGINFWRIHRQKNERHSWTKVPVQFSPTDLGFTGTLTWDVAPTRIGSNISITPYTLGSLSKDFEKGTPVKKEFDFGGEAKVGLTPTLNLDLTVNPDFSQADVDQQITNLSRFSIFFPERRQFFLENADVFTNFGAFPDAPFFSRRIGLDEAGGKVPILYGARISGNLDPRWRMGLLNMQTRSNSSNTSINYTAAALHRRALQRSSIRGLFLNQQNIEKGEFDKSSFSRNATGEFEYISNDGRWTGKASYNHAFKPGVKNQNQFMVINAGFNGRLFQTNLEVQNMGTNFSADMGFVGRLNNYDPISDQVIPVGYTTLSNMTDYSFYPKNKRIVRHWMGMENYVWWVNQGTLNEWYNRVRYFFFFRNTSQLRFRFNTDVVNLLYPFQITDGEPLPAGNYFFREFNLQFNTDLRKKVNYEFFGVYGSFYTGTKTTLRSALNLRTQPWGNFSFNFEMNDIRLPEPYGSTRLWLVNPKIEINFSNTLFWTTFLQYNTQVQNFNINSRLQWRYRPMSDLFLVYTDNYLTEGMVGVKNRALVLKLNYYFQF